MMNQARGPLAIAFKAVGMAMAALTIVFVILDSAGADIMFIFLAIGLFSVAAGSIASQSIGASK